MKHYNRQGSLQHFECARLLDCDLVPRKTNCSKKLQRAYSLTFPLLPKNTNIKKYEIFHQNVL